MSDISDPLAEVREAYKRYRDDIRKKIREFEGVGNCGHERIFLELVYCLLTPQSKAIYAWDIVRELYLNGCLWNCTAKELSEYLRRIRFRFNKSRYIVEAREDFLNGVLDFKDLLEGSPLIVRHRLARRIKGFGYKEASHFLRNIGFTFQIAILDRHILRYMVKFNLISEVPKALSPKRYILLEDRFIWFSKYLGLSPAELDLLLWAIETGYVFK